MNKAKEISTLWSQIKPQIGEMVRLCHEVESHAEVTADAYQRGYEAGVIYGRMCEREKIFKTLEKFSDGDTDIDCLTMGDFRTIMELSKHLQKMKETDNG